MLTSRQEDIELALLALERGWRTPHVTLWEVNKGGARFVCGRAAPDVFAIVMRAWLDGRRALARGEAVLSEPGRLVPVLNPARRLVGFVHAIAETTDSQHRVVAAALEALADVLGAASTETDAETAGADAPEPEWLRRPATAGEPRQRARFLAVLEASEWNLTEAARRLNLHRATVWRRMRRYGITRAVPSPYAPGRTLARATGRG